MNKSSAYLSLVLVAGCAQQTTPVIEAEISSKADEGGQEPPAISPVDIEPLEPSPTIRTPVDIAEPKAVVIAFPAVEGTDATTKPKSKSPPAETTTQDGKLILGREEWVWLPQANQYIKAKVASDETLSLLGVSELQNFERDGGAWVSFRTGGKKIELPVERWEGNKASESRQVVVKLRLILGALNELADVVLTTGKQMVLGENFIRDVAVVDGKRKFVQPKAK